MVLSGGAPAVGQGATPEPRYWIKPSEVAIPPDVPIGMYRRLIRPFENWTLICDENLKSKQRICNVSQLVVDKAGNTVFSWSLAATAQGKPVMILRVPPPRREKVRSSVCLSPTERSRSRCGWRAVTPLYAWERYR